MSRYHRGIRVVWGVKVAVVANGKAKLYRYIKLYELVNTELTNIHRLHQYQMRQNSVKLSLGRKWNLAQGIN